MTTLGRQKLWLLGLLVWTVLGLMSAAQNAAWRAFSADYVLGTRFARPRS